ncbi:MAG: DNA polymerase-3 subunit delta [Spirosomataceae bacterium]|jgi:DNA polymerase-3 subunit delta
MKSNFSTVLKGITKKSLSPLYLFHGKEPYYANQLTERITELAVPISEKSFNEQILFGKDIKVGDIINAARRYPMMAERQLIVVKSAESIQDINIKEQNELLKGYAENPLTSTVLVLQFDTQLDERKSWVKSFTKNAFVFKSAPLYDNELPDFVSSYCQSKGVTISLKANHLLIEHTGNDLPKLTKEIDKILLNLTIGQSIEEEHVEKYVGISKDFNVFELQKALGRRNFAQSFKIITYMGKNAKKNPIQPLIIVLFNYFSKLLLLKYSGHKSETELSKILELRPYFLSEYKMAASRYEVSQVINAIGALKDADLASKGVGTSSNDPNDILRNMLIGIFT